ncbi:MAG: recombinase family protein, partial [Marinomonas sp.]
MLKNISRIRCAIYTRKSNNRLLDKDVNSLVTQRETCSAYIKSQQYKNWSELPEQYDDGGHSGSGLDRPALAQLMQDIDAGLIDMIVVYKIDRLTRSLADFVRLIELLDRQHVALVSISQAFDTSDSMGRMILNILLTFSQFERELVAERVRDNVRVRKRHGLSHGGTVPFGYTNCEEGIEIDEAEAKIVRYIYQQYLKLERYTPVMTAVREAGLRSSRKRLKNGSYKGGKVITSGHVYSILGNPIYVGEIRGPEENYPGRHEPILDRETWDAVQLVRKERKKKIPHPKLADHFLSGILWDDLGRQMLSRVRTRGATIYSTYVSSNTAWSQREYRRQYHCKADELEKVVVASVSDFLSDRRKLRKALVSFGIFGPELEELTAKGQAAAPLLEDANTQHKGEILTAILNRIEVGTENLLLTFRGLELRRFLEWNGWAPFKG